MTPDAYPKLKYMLSSYFHQNWKAPFERSGITPTFEHVVQEFRDSEQDTEVARAVSELHRLIDNGLSDEELQNLTRRLGCQYYPPGDGMTYRAWFRAVLTLLEKPHGSS